MTTLIDYLVGLFQSLVDFFIDIIHSVFDGIYNLFYKLALSIFDSLLSIVQIIINSIPVPDFLTTGLSPYFSQLPSNIIYVLNQSGFFIALSIIGAGVLFSLIAKLLTLFRW